MNLKVVLDGRGFAGSNLVWLFFCVMGRRREERKFCMSSQSKYGRRFASKNERSYQFSDTETNK